MHSYCPQIAYQFEPVNCRFPQGFLYQRISTGFRDRLARMPRKVACCIKECTRKAAQPNRFIQCELFRDLEFKPGVENLLCYPCYQGLLKKRTVAAPRQQPARRLKTVPAKGGTLPPVRPYSKRSSDEVSRFRARPTHDVVNITSNTNQLLPPASPATGVSPRAG